MKKIKFSKKAAALVVASVMLVGGAGAGTLAWLTDTTLQLDNEFEKSHINVTLTEDEKIFKMVPGCVIDKDPVVTVKAGSEDCYVFLEVTENMKKQTEATDTASKYAFDKYIAYQIASENWTQLKNGDLDVSGVYYKKVTNISSSDDTTIQVLGTGTYTETVNRTEVTISWKENQVATKPSVTKEMMDYTTLQYQPVLSFKAYAVQLLKTNQPTDGESGEFTPYEAWCQVAPLSSGTSGN